MTTISVESSFSLLPSSAGSSAKPPATEIQGNAPKLDMVRDIKRRATDEEYQESKRKRKLSDLHGGGSWNDGNWKIGYSMWIAKGRSRGTRKGAWTSAGSTRKGAVWPRPRYACVLGWVVILE